MKSAWLNAKIRIDPNGAHFRILGDWKVLKMCHLLFNEENASEKDDSIAM